MPLPSCDTPNNGPAKPVEENFAHTEAAIHRMSEAESDSVDRCATNVNSDGTADQGELERLLASAWPVQAEEAATQLLKAAQLARRDALRGPRPMIKMIFLILGILTVPMAYYFWMG